MEIQKTIARNIKEARKHKKLTLDNAAKLAGVSRSMLAQIEKGDVNPTISVLWKIANAYKVSFTSLTENTIEDVSVHYQKSTTPLEEDNGRYLNYPVFSFNEKTLFETYRIIIKPKGSLDAQPHLKGAEEYITVFAGNVKITVSGQQYELSKGDSIRFFADVSHKYQNIGDDDVELSMIIYYSKT